MVVDLMAELVCSAVCILQSTELNEDFDYSRSAILVDVLACVVHQVHVSRWPAWNRAFPSRC